jgi:hypothetical protein
MRINAPRALCMVAMLQAAVWVGSLLAQAAEPRVDSWIGEVTAVEASSRRLTVKADNGDTLAIAVAEGASVLRATPGAKSLAEATASSLEEIAVGDRVLVRGARSEDGATLAARQVVVMARDDIARKQEAERADWRRRGVLGTVTAVDPVGGEITLQVGRGATARTLLLPTAGRTVAFRRYAPDSVKFSDAKPSSVAEVKVGDELRALGDRSSDEKVLLADQAVFGSFRLVAGSVTSVEPGKNEITLRDEESGRKLTVGVGPDARLRRLPPEMAARLARRRPEGDGAPGGPPDSRRPDAGGPPRTAAPGGEPPEGGGGPRPQWGRGQGGAAEDLLERMPVTTFADLKVGDRILVSSTRGGDVSRLNAIALVTGLETLAVPRSSGRAARGPESTLPPELTDLGMSIQ